MGIFKKINKFCGIIALLSFMIMSVNMIITRNDQSNPVFYYCCAAFVIFSTIFMLTALVFVIYNLIHSISHRKFIRLIRHYLYATAFFYIMCILFDYVIHGCVSLPSYILPSLALGIIQVYWTGYKTAEQPQSVC